MIKHLTLACAFACAAPAQVASAGQAPFAPAPAVDPAAVTAVDVSFAPTADDQKGFEKYFFFHREGTDFATAYADLNECDSFARAVGPSSTYDPNAPMMQAIQQQMIAQHGMAGAAGSAVGGLIGGLIAAEAAAAEQRKVRRRSMRSCMGFKEYQTYGLPKVVWQSINSESSSLEEEVRVKYLQMQAKLASGPKPTVGQIR